MIFSEIEEKYGREMAEKIMKNRYMQGITCIARRKSDGKIASYNDFNNKDFEFDFFEDDVRRAFRDVTGQFIHPLEWD